jgi:hypothetical protein
MKSESLDAKARRIKARWLSRAMYDVRLTSTEKCFAYLIADRLNCVTLDSWPAQSTIAAWLGVTSLRTVQRAARRLQHLDYLAIKPRVDGHAGFRYAPTFSPEDLNKSVTKNGHACSGDIDTDVTESSLDIHLKSSPTPSSASGQAKPRASGQVYRPAQRGQIEMSIATLLGKDGVELLTCLAALDDVIVERLCRAYAENSLSRRDIAAARLAAGHYRSASLGSRSRARTDALSALRRWDAGGQPA